jgi:hypothetical protein
MPRRKNYTSKEVEESLLEIDCFKNVRVDLNEIKEIFDCYARILAEDGTIKDIFNDISTLEYEDCHNRFI